MNWRFSLANSAPSDGARLGLDHLIPRFRRGLSFGPRWRPSGGQRHGQDSIIAGVKRRSILILMAFLASIGLISEGAAQQQGSRYTRLILYNGTHVRQYELMQFASATDTCNFFGATSTPCSFANDYFAGWGGPYTATLEFARFPTESSRAHIYGGGVVALSTPARLAAALDAGTTLRVPLNGVTLTACFGTGAGCTNLAGLTTYEQIASAGEFALNASPVTLGTITGTITPVSMPINVGVWRDTAHVQVNSVGGTLYNGAYVCATSIPCLSSSSDQIDQIENQMIWAPETVLQGPGWYSWFNTPARNGFHMRYRKETINGTASYGVLTVTSYDSGSAIAAPMGINDGGVHIPATTYVWECISLCGQVGAQWIVNNAATVSQPEKINLTPVQVLVIWNSRANGPMNWGYFDVAQIGAAQPIGVNTIGYATGSAAKILGLSEGSPGYPGVLYSGAFASSPGNTVTSIGAWLREFRASVDSSWTSCEIDYPADLVPDTLPNEIQDWAIKHPPIQCPASWVTTPPSTPSLLSCIHQDPTTCPPQ